MSDLTYKIWSDKWWHLSDNKTSVNAETWIHRYYTDGVLSVEPFKIETEDNLRDWVDSFNGWYSKWSYYLGGGQYARKTPEESANFKPLIADGAKSSTTYCVVIQTPQDKRGPWDGIPNGLFCYPSNRESLRECEDMIGKLKLGFNPT